MIKLETDILMLNKREKEKKIINRVIYIHIFIIRDMHINTINKNKNQ